MDLRSTPWVKQFRRAAIAHAAAAELLLTHCDPKSASAMCGEVVYLSGYVAECGLKAVLMSWTPDSRHSKTIASFKKPSGAGHDLEKLRNLIVVSGCPVPIRTTEQVRLLAARWFTGLRYEGRRFSFAGAARLHHAAQTVLVWVED